MANVGRVAIITRLSRVLVGAAALALAAAPSGMETRRLAIQNVTLIDGTIAPPRAGMTIIVEGDHIVSVTELGDVPPDAVLVEGRGRHLIPGLWDMHVHLTGAGDLGCQTLVANGVTSVRDMGGELDIVDWMRERISRGKLIGPRIIRPGPFVDGLKPGLPDRLVLERPEDGRAAVAFLKARGVDFIKVHTGVPAEPYFALLAAAREAGLQVIGHLPHAVDPATAIEAGHASVEHVVALFEGPVTQAERAGKSQAQAIAEITDDKIAALARVMVKRGTAFDPTLVVYWARSYQWDLKAAPDARERYVAASSRESWKQFRNLPDRPEVRAMMAQVFERFLQITRLVHREGVRILAGTDYLLLGFALHDELGWLVKAGLTPAEALAAATRNAAEAAGLDGELGTIEPGKRADLVLLDGNPLDDIANTKRIAAVVAQGRLYDRAALDAILERVAQAAPSH
jgi:imidazolonepropionase-like amidohydrolase